MSRKGGKRRKKRVWIVLLCVFVLIAGGLGGGLLFSSPGRKEIRELSIGNVDFSNLRDGTYVGKYTGTKDHFRDTEVQVKIEGGEIAAVDIKKGALDKKGKPAELTGGRNITELFNEVVATQSLQVDVISGATLTSKTHLKALENALKQATPSR